MDVAEPRMRRRGFVVIHTDPNLDLEDESESAEGVTVRVRIARPKLHGQIAVTSSRTPEAIAGRGALRQSESSSSDPSAVVRARVKSVTATGTRQRSHSPR